MKDTPRPRAAFQSAAFWQGFFSVWGHPFTVGFCFGAGIALIVDRLVHGF